MGIFRAFFIWIFVGGLKNAKPKESALVNLLHCVDRFCVSGQPGADRTSVRDSRYGDSK